MSDIRFVDLSEQPTAAVREQVRTTELPDFFGRAFTAVLHALRAQDVMPSGPPFALYHGMPADTVDVEAGFPVPAPVEPEGAVVRGVLPAGRAVEAVHVGPYDTLPTTYGQVLQRIEEDGRQPSSTMWEYYLSDPETEPDPSTWRTRVVWPEA